MVHALAYSVVATLPDETVAEAYVAWLTGGHVQLVLEHGATSALVVRLDSEGGLPRVETRYVFPSRAVFDHYVRTAATALRADGLKRFGPDRGVVMERRVGQVVFASP